MATRGDSRARRHHDTDGPRPVNGDAVTTPLRPRPKGLAPSLAVREGERPRAFQPQRAQIARRAFLLYLARGAQPGHELDDWLQAERELIAGAVGDFEVV